MENKLSNAKLSFIGCGVMAEAIVAELLKKALCARRKRLGKKLSSIESYKFEISYFSRFFLKKLK